MKYFILAVAFLVTGCNSADDRADTLSNVLKDCRKGATVSIAVSIGVLGSNVETKCEWVKR